MGQRWFGNWKIAGRILIGFAAILAVNAVVAIYGVLSLPRAHPHPPDNAIVPALATIADLRASLAAYHDAEWQYLASRTEAERRESEKHLRENLQAISSAQGKNAVLAPESKELNSKDEFNRSVARYLAISQQVVDLMHPHIVPASPKRIHARHRRHPLAVGARKSKAEKLAADLLSGPVQNALAETDAALKTNAGLRLRQWEDAQRASAADVANDALASASALQRVQRAALVGSGVSLLIAIVIAYSIARPMRLLVASARRIAAGDLSADAVILECSDEIGELGRFLDEIQTGLRAMVKTAAGCKDRVTAVGEMVSLVGTRHSEVRLELEHALQAAAAVQQLTLTNKGTSQQFRQTVIQAMEDATEGANITETALAQIQMTASEEARISVQMLELVKSSRQIAQELALVEDIARQTNAIALNAGIERARSSDKDRRFVVITGETVTLAERTGRAAKEIGRVLAQFHTMANSAGTMMGQGKCRAEDVVKAVVRTGEILQTILAASQEARGAADDVDAQMSQQMEAIDQVGTKLEKIARINHELSEDGQRCADAARVLSEVSAELKTLQEFGARPLMRTKENSGETTQVLDWRINRHAMNAGLGEATGTNGPAIHSVSRPGGAKIHARLLSESEAKAQPRAPSSASEGWRA